MSKNALFHTDFLANFSVVATYDHEKPTLIYYNDFVRDIFVTQKNFPVKNSYF